MNADFKDNLFNLTSFDSGLWGEIQFSLATLY